MTSLWETGCVMKLAYLTDIFKKLNDLSLSIQGKAVTVFEASYKYKRLKRKSSFGRNQ